METGIAMLMQRCLSKILLDKGRKHNSSAKAIQDKTPSEAWNG